MQILALASDESCYISGLRFDPMDTKESLGQRLVAAVIPSRFKTLDDELVRRSHCPAWVTLAVREFLLRWDPSGIRILQVV